MIFKEFKKIFYFPVAYYFRLFAQIQLSIWKPRIIVITGSNSKTTLLHLIESQLGDKALYSHLANSTYGIPFNILGLKRRTLMIWEWPFLFLLAPIKAFKNPPSEKLYIVEADCDRPEEGEFLGKLLNPEVTLWTNSFNSHAQNFDDLVKSKQFSTVEDAVAFEFGYFLQYTSKLSVINGDIPQVLNQVKRTKSKIEKIIKKGNLQDYKILKNETRFSIGNQNFSFKYLLPEDNFYAILACLKLLDYLGIQKDVKFSKFNLPPGRSSLFEGIKNTTIIDSSYNATPASVKAVLDLVKKYPGNKWLILGDMIELGESEKKEHENLAKDLEEIDSEEIVLVGPRLAKYTYPKLKNKTKVKLFDKPKPALDYIKSNIKGKEVLLFKGARFLEGIIEHLLSNKDDISNLCRREVVWQDRRKKWGL